MNNKNNNNNKNRTIHHKCLACLAMFIIQTRLSHQAMLMSLTYLAAITFQSTICHSADR